jgi:sortase A
MPVHSRPPADDQDAAQLLKHLIESPPPPSDGWKAPVALRSKAELKRHALSRYLLRNWVDHVLAHAERILALAALVVFGLWFADGPLRDWWHERQASGAPSALAAPGATQPAGLGSGVQAPLESAEQPTAATAGVGAAAALAAQAPLPYVTDQMADAAPDAAGTRPTAPLAQGAQHARKVAPEPSRLVVPALGLDTPVREVFVVDGAWEVAEYAAGYLDGTALPGDNGNTVLAGHAGLRGAVFRDLGRLVPGDEVFVEAGGKLFRYSVRSSTAVWPTQTEVLDPSATPILTMITCTNWDTQRLVVVADLLDTQPLGASNLPGRNSHATAVSPGPPATTRAWARPSALDGV